jgi:hypothetical protein
MRNYDQTTQPMQPTQSQPAYSDRQFLHTFTAAALIPLVQATITAIVACVGTATVLYVFDAIDYMKPIIAIGALTWVITWLLLQRRWLTLTNLERLLKQDLNNDTYVGEPEPASIRIQLDEIRNNGHIHQTQMFELPCTEAQLQALADGVLRLDKTLAEKEWTGAGKPFSINEFRTVRSEMLKRGMVVPASSKSERQGFVFTRAGEAVLKHYAPSPSPIQDGS